MRSNDKAKCFKSADNCKLKSSAYNTDDKNISKAITENQQVFIRILKDFIHDRPSSVGEAVDWNVVKAYADSHQVTAILYYQTKQPIFQPKFAAQISRSLNYAIAVEKFKAAMSCCEFAMVKGAVISSLYTVPALRSMGDVDTLIHIEDRDTAHKALIDAGFDLVSKEGNLGEWIYDNNGYLFEVHDSLVHRYDEKESLVEYFSHIWDYINGGELNWTFHLIYLTEHLRQHLVGKGVGFRQFVDIAVVCKKCDIDWAFLARELKKIDLYNFALTVFTFIKLWFEIDVPFGEKEISNEFYARATEQIFNNGVFGTEEMNRHGTNLTFEMHYKRVDYSMAKRQYIFKSLFPTYDAMCRLPFCAYVRSNKLLLPVAWIHRMVLKAVDKNSLNDMKKRISEDEVMSKMNMLKQWGL